MIRVLQIVPSINCCGGVENYIMNYYRHINKEKFIFDFVYHLPEDKANFKSEIEMLGGKCFKIHVFNFSNLRVIEREINELLRNNKYDIVHCHMANAAFMFFKIAKKQGIKVRILHSHQTSAADKIMHALRNYPLLKVGKHRATNFIACSDLAGKYLFKKNYTVINNAVEIDKYFFNDVIRKEVRHNYGIKDDEICIGNIGRLCNQKNHKFLIEVFNNLCGLYPQEHFKLLMVGNGELRQKLEDKVNSLKLNNIIFAGSTTEAYKYYNAFDIFVLPSLYEGLPVVGVEAQYNGLNVLTTTNVTKELNFSGNVNYLSLDENINVWAKTLYELILKQGKRNSVVNDSYNIKVQTQVLEDYYLKLAKVKYE